MPQRDEKGAAPPNLPPAGGEAYELRLFLACLSFCSLKLTFYTRSPIKYFFKPPLRGGLERRLFFLTPPLQLLLPDDFGNLVIQNLQT